MKKLITIFLIFFAVLGFSSFMCSCMNRDHCNNSLDIVGVYENRYESGVKNYLTINSDGTFEQIYTKNKTTKKNKGKWVFFEKSCSVRFDTLRLLHELPTQEIESSFEGMIGLFRNNNILFYEDMPKQYNYYRKK